MSDINSKRSITAIAVFLFAVSLFAASANPTAQQSAKKDAGTLVFVVSHADSENDEGTMDAVVRIKDGKFLQPYPEENETAQAEFAKQYLAGGKKYRVTFGGGEIGHALVESWSQGCSNIHSTVRLDDGGRITTRLSGLATDSLTLGKKPSSRRAPTDAERQSVMNLVRQIYRTRRTTPAMLRGLSTTNLTATDLDGDGKFEMVGSFVIETKAKARRDLLLIAEPSSADPKAFVGALVHFQSYKLPDEGFDSAVNFVDQLDLDGDGIAEVFALQHGFDAYGYHIYKKSRGRWREVFRTIGDAC